MSPCPPPNTLPVTVPLLTVTATVPRFVALTLPKALPPYTLPLIVGPALESPIVTFTPFVVNVPSVAGSSVVAVSAPPFPPPYTF